MVTTLVRGRGRPVTVFAHGFGEGVAQTRTLASGVDGTRVFYTARGHDGQAPGQFDYATLADDLRAVADSHDATQALGTSMGAGALCRLLSRTPRRFARLVFFLPAVLDTPRPKNPARERLWLTAGSGDTAATAALVRQAIPAASRDTPAAQRWAAERARLLTMPSLRGLGALLGAQAALDDAAALEKVDVPALVLACHHDPAHPLEVAQRLAEVLPCAELNVFPDPDLLWTHRARLRELISTFLASGSGRRPSPDLE